MLPSGRDLSRPHGELILRVRSQDKERLDRYLMRRLGWPSRHKVQLLIQSGRVSRDDHPVKASQRVRRGDVFRVVIDPGGALPQDESPVPSPFWEDPYLLAIDKPAGILVHPVGKTVRGTVINELHRHYRALNEVSARRVVPRLCHRLDRETSGLLLVAKTSGARRRLQQAFEADQVHKEYLAVIEGEPAEERITVEVPVATSSVNHTLATGNRLARAESDGKPSVTHFEVLGRGPGFTVVRCRPITGRQNQIRVHLASLGHPILGDVGYSSNADRWGNSPAGRTTPFPGRALLHSSALSFPHPVWGARLSLSVPTAPDMLPFLHLADGP